MYHDEQKGEKCCWSWECFWRNCRLWTSRRSPEALRGSRLQAAGMWPGTSTRPADVASVSRRPLRAAGSNPAGGQTHAGSVSPRAAREPAGRVSKLSFFLFEFLGSCCWELCLSVELGQQALRTSVKMCSLMGYNFKLGWFCKYIANVNVFQYLCISPCNTGKSVCLYWSKQIRLCRNAALSV